MLHHLDQHLYRTLEIAGVLAPWKNIQYTLYTSDKMATVANSSGNLLFEVFGRP